MSFMFNKYSLLPVAYVLHLFQLFIALTAVPSTLEVATINLYLTLSFSEYPEFMYNILNLL